MERELLCSFFSANPFLIFCFVDSQLLPRAFFLVTPLLYEERISLKDLRIWLFLPGFTDASFHVIVDFLN